MNVAVSAVSLLGLPSGSPSVHLLIRSCGQCSLIYSQKDRQTVANVRLSAHCGPRFAHFEYALRHRAYVLRIRVRLSLYVPRWSHHRDPSLYTGAVQ